MSRIKRGILFFIVLLISMGVTAYGLWLFRNALIEGNRKDGERAMYVFLGGGILVPATLVILINRFIKSERVLPYRKRKSPGVPRNFKKSERLIRRMHFAKRYPSIVFLFCIIALLVSGVMAFAPVLNPDLQDALFLQLLGIAVLLSVSVFLVFLIHSVATKKWGPSMDASIQILENKLADAKAKAASPYDNTPAVE